jgi:stage V sporulation protein AE
MIMDFVWAFLIGGALCAIAQILLDNTKLVSGQILIIYIVGGCILTFFGLYEPLFQLGGAGATIPLTGFGYALVKGAIHGVTKYGFFGAFTGGITSTAAGVGMAIFVGVLGAMLFSSKTRVS